MLRSSRIRYYLVVSFASVILLCVFSLQVVQGADLSVIVNPSTGIDSLSCNSDPPCKTIAYAIHSRNASLVYLAAGCFNESNVIINSSSPVVSITGLNGSSSTVFDCNRRSFSGPAFSIVNTAVSISGITFQNCANFDGLNGIGGAVSAIGGSVTVSDCKFFNNTAQIGGAIGVKSSSLVVSSCVFEDNTATCPNAASTTTACSAWGGAIGTEESPSVSIIGNRFNSNWVNLVLNGVLSPISKAVGGGGCISVMHNGNVSESRVRIDGNFLQSCWVRMFGLYNAATFQGIQYGNTYGGAVSLYYGLKAVVSLVVQNVSSAFISNQCRSSGIVSSVGQAGNAYGGCLSVYVGAWSVGLQVASSIGSLTLSSMETNISGNIITNCSATKTGRLNSFGANVYGGGMSLAVGAYSYSFSFKCPLCSSIVSGNTTVSSTSYTISSNILTNCNATSSASYSSNGANVYGGGLSLALGAYSYSYGGGSSSSIVSGNTTVSSTSYTISSNNLTNCIAASLVTDASSVGANVYGGGMSLALGAYSFSYAMPLLYEVVSSSSSVSGNTTVSSTSYTISSNILTNCNATSSVTGEVSFGANVYGGGLSLALGAYSYSYGGESSSSIVSGNTMVSSTSYTISSNNLTNCIAASLVTDASSVGANVYGGGMSLALGAYSFSYSFSCSYCSSSSVSGNTTVSSTSYTISSNILTNCNATSLVTVTGGNTNGVNSYGANVYGGGMSLALGAYSLATPGWTRFQISYQLSEGAYSYVSEGGSSVSGSTTMSSTSYTISSNILTNCNSASLFTVTGGNTNGANVYGGGLSLALGAYSYSYGGFYSNGKGSRGIVSGNTTVSSTSYIISSNILTNCNATSLASYSSNGANVYGGGLSLALGAYSYSLGVSSSSIVSGNTTVSSTSYTISSNNLTNCNAASLASYSSNGANVYGGGLSLALGAYSYHWGLSGSSIVSGNTTVSSTSYAISSSMLTNCSVLSKTFGTSNGASAYGGAFSVVHSASSFPSNSSSFVEVIAVSSVLQVNNCSFSECFSTTSSASCASGASNAAGGAVFARVPSLAVDFIASLFSNATATTTCGASSLSTYSLGGGMSIFQAGNVNVTFTNFTGCHAQGVPQSNNVFVSGGGLHIQASVSFLFQKGTITNCSVRHAFSTFLQSGGGALSTQNVSIVQISDSIFRDNSDSSSSGILFLQQLQEDCGMNVTMHWSLVLIEPSITPAFNVSCGSNCSRLQQQRIKVRFQNFNISAYSEARAVQYDTSAMMSLPTSSVVDSDRKSSLNCLFNFINNVAILIANTGAAFSPFVTLSCAPCARPFEIAQTSRTLDLSNFQNVTNLGKMLCKTTASSDLQQCPYGLAFCSTIVNVSVGFWASFSADGKLGNATHCPRNYCGCRNILDYKNRFCQLEPPFSPIFQPDVQSNENLCNGNRTGVLCGGCRTGFTQSLDGYSCIHNDECLQNVRWTWAVSIIGYVLYSLYIVISSLQASKLGLIKCMLFYGQMSTFAQLSAISAGSQASQSSSMSSWLPRVSQFESIASLSSKTCYGTDIGAYSFTAMQLYGPAIVLMFSLALTLVLKRAQPFLQRHNICVEFSIPATITNVILLIFSSVSTVIFKLITCSNIVIDNLTEGVVFIDGTVKCYDEKWKSLIAVVVLLCVFPFLFAAALHFRWLPQNVQKSVCGAYSESRFYWGAVTLLFRLAMSTVFTTIRTAPSTAALIRCFLCMAIIILIMHQKPYCHASTYLFDILCHAILVVLFGLVAIETVSDSLGFVPSENNLYSDTLNRAAEAILYLRYLPRYVTFNYCLH